MGRPATTPSAEPTPHARASKALAFAHMTMMRASPQALMLRTSGQTLLSEASSLLRRSVCSDRGRLFDQLLTQGVFRPAFDSCKDCECVRFCSPRRLAKCSFLFSLRFVVHICRSSLDRHLFSIPRDISFLCDIADFAK